MKRLSNLCISYILFVIIIPRIAIEPIADSFHINYDYLNDTYNILTTIILSFVAMYLYKDELKLDWSRLKKGNWIICGFIGLFLILFISTALSLLVLKGNIEQSSNQQYIETLSTPIVTNILPIVIVLFAPLLEEILFKGYLIKTLSAKLNTYLLAILSILLFSSMHLHSITEIKAIIPYFAISFVTTFYFFKKDYNIWYPIIIHILNNLLAQIIMFLS